ncbi:hypothetical protein [Microcoleus sp. BROC3]|uniref:hypothetical protein n=1 Tax=Microcoleus sp. BROC3 TaxID=3055323 RepID=UPI002FD1CE56
MATLKTLMMSLAGKPKPDRPQSVWIVNCPPPEQDDFAGAMAFRPASYGQAECQLEDKFRFDREGVYLGTTASLAGAVAHLTAEEIDRDWQSVCRMMNW